jgi:hypothetical protein
MKILICCLIVSGLIGSAQKLETQTLDPKKVIRVETAKDHLTVLELGEPVTMVAVGNQNAFSIERRENKVFVKPIEDDAETNLFIWTSTGRFSYELVPAKAVDQMHFAIDQVSVPVAKIQPEKEPLPKPSPIPADMLTRAKPILLQGHRETQGRVEIALRDLYQDGSRLFVRYAVINHSAREYDLTTPAISRLLGVHSPVSLIPFREHQLGERLVRSIRSESQIRFDVVDANQVAQVAAGGQGFGWLAIEEVGATEISVLRLEFASDDRGPVDAVLVLGPANGRTEVVNVRPSVE